MNEENNYKKICTSIEEKIGFIMESPTAFDKLSNDIYLKTGEHISSTTLKRLYGYISPSVAPRPSTLSILAHYLGYAGWRDYVAKNLFESRFITNKSICSSALNVGDHVRFEWEPNRLCIAEYCGDNNYKIIHAENSRLKEGDTFTATFFALKEPLYINNLHQATPTAKATPNYVAGFRSGLTNISLQKREEQ